MSLLKLFQSRIQLKLIIVLIAVFGLTLITSTIVLLMSINQLGRMSIQRQLDEEKLILTQHFAEMESQLLQTVNLVSQQPDLVTNIATNDFTELGTTLEVTMIALELDGLWILDSEKQVLASYVNQQESVTNRSDFLTFLTLQDEPLVDLTMIDQTYVMVSVSPIQDANTNLIGYVVAGNIIDSKRLGEINFYRDSLALVLFADKSVSSGISANEINDRPHLVDDEIEALRLSGSSLVQIQNGISLQNYDVMVRDTLHAVAYLPLEVNGEYQGYYAIAIDENEPRAFQATILSVSFATIIVLLCLIALFALASTWHLILYPLEMLSEAARQFGQGDTDIRVSSSRSDEIGKLFITFNTMAERITGRTKELNNLNNELENRVRERTAQIEQQTVWLETIVCQAKEAIIVTNASGNLAIINEVALSIMNLHEDDPGGRALTQLIQDVAGQHITLPTSSKEVHDELEIGNCFYQYSIAPIEVGISKQISGYVCILTDITTLRRFNALQSQIIRIAAHDLRSPMTALGIQLHLLGKTGIPLSDKQQEILNHIKMTIGSMHEMVDKLLNVDRIEQQISGMSETVMLDTLVSSAVTMLEPQFNQKQLRVSVDIEQNLPLLCGDPVRLLEVLRNLLSNAYKYTQPNGEIAIKGYVKEKAIYVDIHDTGIGIDEQDIPHIFEGEFRAQTALESGVDGLGVGLSLTKEIIQEHGGKISVTSQKGAGTTFRFYLPIP